MSVAIRIPTQLRSLTGGAAQIDVDAPNVQLALKELDTTHPGFGERIFDDSGRLRRFVNVFLNDEDIRYLDGPDTEVTPGQTISIVPAVAGG